MAKLARGLMRGAIAGAAGTTALNAATYLDMTLRGRSGSSTPQMTVERMADLAGRASGHPRSLAATALLAWITALLAGLGVTDPRQWQPADWAADLVPHAVYAVVTAAALRRFD